MSPHATSIRELTAALGPATESGRPFGVDRLIAADEAGEFPEAAVRELDRLGLPQHYVPVALGGRLCSYSRATQLLRVIAERDLTTAIAHAKTFLGAVPVWVAGSPRQSAWLAGEIASGAIVSWGLTEEAHGSDLLASDLTAIRCPSGYVLNGRKWPINNATRGRLVTVLARTGSRPGARSLTTFLLDRQKLPVAAYRSLPRERLHGIRGADISGFELIDARLSADCVVGAEGAGLEITYRSLLVTRALCPGLSLGAADAALAEVLDHVQTSRRFGRSLIDLPLTRRRFADLLADRLLAEVTTLVAARSLHALPREVACSSQAVKYLVPAVVDDLLSGCGELLGAAGLMRPHPGCSGRFQKVLRDHRVVGIFDGSSVVTRAGLVGQFPLIARSARADPDHVGVARATALGTRLPDVDFGRIELVARRGSSLVANLPQLAAAACERGLPAQVAELVHRAGRWSTDLLARIRQTRPDRFPSADQMSLAEDFAWTYAAAAAIAVWVNAEQRDGPQREMWTDGLWLAAVLSRVAARIEAAPCGPGTWWAEPLVGLALTYPPGALSLTGGGSSWDC